MLMNSGRRKKFGGPSRGKKALPIKNSNLFSAPQIINGRSHSKLAHCQWVSLPDSHLHSPISTPNSTLLWEYIWLNSAARVEVKKVALASSHWVQYAKNNLDMHLFPLQPLKHGFSPVDSMIFFISACDVSTNGQKRFTRGKSINLSLQKLRDDTLLYILDRN